MRLMQRSELFYSPLNSNINGKLRPSIWMRVQNNIRKKCRIVTLPRTTVNGALGHWIL